MGILQANQRKNLIGCFPRKIEVGNVVLIDIFESLSMFLVVFEAKSETWCSSFRNADFVCVYFEMRTLINMDFGNSYFASFPVANLTAKY